MNDTLADFIEKHQIRVLDTNKRKQVYNRLTPLYFRDPSDFNKVLQDTIEYQTESVYTVEITENELKRLSDFEAQVFNNMKQHGHFNIFELLMKQKEEEKFLKEKYPAVKKAYEQYSLMLQLAKAGEL